MAYRTFGWIQNPSSFESLHHVVALFDNKSAFNKEMRLQRIPLLHANGLFATETMADQFITLLEQPQKGISYDTLKGQGNGKGSRTEAKCSGIVQAAIDAQRDMTLHMNGHSVHIKKPYTDDWTADGFLRWAISLGFLDYEDHDDSCTITSIGKRLAAANSKDERDKVIGEVMLSYPPACRILNLLRDGQAKTKFELGRQLGFTTEAGFTSYPQNIWAYTYVTDPEQRQTLRSNAEGSSDKYARMIARWLTNLGWVRKCSKEIPVSLGAEVVSCRMSAFVITADGISQSKHISGTSKATRTTKRVLFQMLATKAPDSNYLRLRRSHIIKALTRQHAITIDEIRLYLANLGIEESNATISDDIEGLTNIGLNVVTSPSGLHIADTITGLIIPHNIKLSPTTEATLMKERVRLQLARLPHRHLALIDYAFDGQSNRDFETGTIDLLVNELDFGGTHLGGARRPDGVIYDKQRGVIIDNKAYPKGYAIPISHADEMVRYITENQTRDRQQNPNQWWTAFPDEVSDYSFAFVAPYFTGNFAAQLRNISQRTDINGCAIGVEQLLICAEHIKQNTLTRQQLLSMINKNDELRLPVG